MSITPDSINSFAQITIWIVNLLYFLAILPQIWLNYKLKSTKGLSDFMLLGYMLGYGSQVYYNFCLGLPNGYKVMAPFGLFGVLIMIFQRIYYHKTDLDLVFLTCAITIWCIFILGIPIAFIYPIITGHIAGWITTVAWSVYQIPQAFKIYQQKSVKGLSLPFILILGLGILIETISGFILHLPMPTIFNNIRSISAYVIFLGIYFYYMKKNNHYY